MGVMVQIRHMPEAMHRKLKARAAEAGMSLSEFLLKELEKTARIPTESEFKERLAQLPPVNFSGDEIVKIIREGREEREQHLWDVLNSRDRR